MKGVSEKVPVLILKALVFSESMSELEKNEYLFYARCKFLCKNVIAKSF